MNINLNCPLSTMTSYGITGLNLTEALTKLGHEVSLFPIGGVSYFPYQESILPSLKRGETPVCETFNEVSVRLYHQFSLFEHTHPYHIGFPIFELDNFSEQEKASINWCEELIVCTQWARGVINEHFPNMFCRVVPLGVDQSIFSPSEPTNEFQGREKPFTFFYPGKFEYRKGFDRVTDLFDKAFPSENVEVHFLPQNLFIQDNDDWARSLMSSNLGRKGRVKIHGRLETPQQVADLVRHADAVVSFSRAEGWNLPLLEALSCARTVVATNYSGHTEFLTPQNSVLLDVEGREPAVDGVFFNGSGNWLSFTESDEDNFVEALRTVYKQGRKYNAEGVETAKQFSWENSAQKLIEAVS